jgi:excisionase family DNA binding protein
MSKFNTKKIIYITEIAEILNINRTTVIRWIENEKLPKPFKLGNRNAWDINVFNEWFHSNVTVKQGEQS